MPRKKKNAPVPHDILPLLPLKDVVIFPRMVVPLLVGRPASIGAIEISLASKQPLFLCAQRVADVEEPSVDELHEVGIAADILQTLRMPDGTMKVVVEGLGRGRLHKLNNKGAYVEAEVSPVTPDTDAGEEMQALMRTAITQFEDYVRISQRVSPDLVTSMKSVLDADTLADLICAYIPLRVDERQELLNELAVPRRLERIASALMRENEMLAMEHRVRDRVREQMDRSQREYFLHEQMKAIHQELGTDESSDEFTELREQIRKAKMPSDVEEKALRELTRYERMPSMSPESSIVRNYIEWLAEMPWDKRSKAKLSLEKAQKILDEDHYGLTKVKERILEFLAVQKLSKSTRGPVLCLVGPPGVGKTSLGRSVARAMGREFVRVSLGGIRDEAEIRGHRRTYIGALPGRIVQSMKKVGVKNPVFMLDEIDKMSTDFRGDPSSALLEVLDPEQNKAFSDHYLEVDFDLHEVFWITTANSQYEIPEALLDRLEVVRISGYTPFEKERIAREYLIPKQMTESGLTKKNIAFASGGLQRLIARYTREAGVRELERQIANLCRKVARRMLEKKHKGKFAVTEKSVVELLGPEEYPEQEIETEPNIGLAIGLAWTWSGGETLHIETSLMPGKGALALTGQLGDVMKESAHAAYTYLRAHARELGIPPKFYENADIHVHVPEGAIPKDGPSAGVCMAVSMLSALRGKPPLDLVAMTGEITLRGRILPVGGVKEKVLAAHRAQIKRVILPRLNEKDLHEVPAEILQELDIVYVSHVDEVFKLLFEPPRTAGRKAKAKPKPKPKARTKKRA